MKQLHFAFFVLTFSASLFAKTYNCTATESQNGATQTTLGTLQVITGQSMINTPTLTVANNVILSCVSQTDLLFCYQSDASGHIQSEAANFEPVTEMGFVFSYGQGASAWVVTVDCK